MTKSVIGKSIFQLRYNHVSRETWKFVINVLYGTILNICMYTSVLISQFHLILGGSKLRSVAFAFQMCMPTDVGEANRKFRLKTMCCYKNYVCYINNHIKKSETYNTIDISFSWMLNVGFRPQSHEHKSWKTSLLSAVAWKTWFWILWPYPG